MRVDDPRRRRECKGLVRGCQSQFAFVLLDDLAHDVAVGDFGGVVGAAGLLGGLVDGEGVLEIGVVGAEFVEHGEQVFGRQGRPFKMSVQYQIQTKRPCDG